MAEKFAEAEQLYEKEDYEEAVEAAKEAAEQFKSASDVAKQTDAVVLLVKIWLALIDQFKYEKRFGWKYDVEDLLKEMDEYCGEARQDFESANYARGVGAMHLSLAQMMSDRKNPTNLAKAVEASAKAVELLESTKPLDSKLLIAAYLARSNVLFKSMQGKEAEQVASKAIRLAQETGDLKSMAQGTMHLAMGQGMARQFHKGYDTHMEVLRLYRELGDKKAQAIQLYTIANWQLTRQKPKEAIQSAKESLSIFESIEMGKGWQGAALRILVTCYIARQEFGNAMKTTERMIAKWTKMSDHRMLAMGNDILAHVHLAQHNEIEALQASRKALDIVIGLDDDEWEADMRKTLALILSKTDDHEAEEENLEASAKIFKKLKNDVQEIKVMCRLAEARAHTKGAAAYGTTFREARKLAAEKGRPTDQAYVEWFDASTLDKAGDFDNAAICAQKAADIYQSFNNHEGQVLALGIVADCKHKLGDLNGAMIAAKRRLGLAKGGFQLKATGSAYQKVAELLLDKKEFKQAIATARLAKEACQRCDDHYGRVLANIAIISGVVHTLDQAFAPKKGTKDWQALVQYGSAARSDAIKWADKMPGAQVKGTVMYWSSHLSYFEGTGYDALEEASEARSLLYEGGNMGSVGRCSILLGMIYKDLDNKDSAIDMLEDGLNHCKTAKDKVGMDMAKDMLTKLGYYDKPQMPAMAGMTPEMMQMMMSMQGGAAPVAKAPVAAAIEAAASSAAAAPTALAVPQITKEQILPAIVRMASEVAASDDSLTADVSLMDAGIDSLAAVSFRNELAKAYDIALPASVMFDYPTINDLSQFVVDVVTESA